MIRDICPVCAAAATVQLDYLENMPVMLNRLGNSEIEARAIPRGVLDIVGCGACGFVWNRCFDPDKVLYDLNYENDQTHSHAFRQHLQSIAAKVLTAVSADDVTEIVEVGCGQAVFLRTVASEAGPQLRRAVGFDPAFRGQDGLEDKRIQVFKIFFNERTVELLEGTPSLVITRHTIEHVADPVGFLRTIRRGIGDTPARLFVETPDVGWIISRGECEDFFYEHCSLFDPYSLTLALEKAGFTSARVEFVFDDQYLWAEATINRAAEQDMAVPVRRVAFPDLSATRQAFIADWRRRIEGAGPVVVWGAGAKGVTFCALIDPDASRFAAVIDINPAKQNKFIPLAGHAVLAPEILASLCPKTVIVMNPNYREEVEAMLVELGVDAVTFVLEGTPPRA